MPESFVVKILSSLILAFLFAFPASALANYLRIVFYVPFVRRKLIDNAIAQGHDVQAKLTKHPQRMLDNGSTVSYSGSWEAHYQYSYKGKEYRYKGVFTSYPPEEITLYFESNPARAGLGNEMGIRESRWKKFYGWMVIVCFVAFLVYEASKYVS